MVIVRLKGGCGVKLHYKKGPRGKSPTYKRQHGGRAPHFRLRMCWVNISPHGLDEVWMGSLGIKLD